MEHIALSVIIPVFNEREKLSPLIECCLADYRAEKWVLEIMSAGGMFIRKCGNGS